MPEALAAAIAAILIVPHLLPQRRLAPWSGIMLWVAVLALRAVVAVSLAMMMVVYLPATELFRAITHWCVHAVLPVIATHLGFDGHRLGDAAILVPALALAASLLWVSFGVWRGARAIRGWLRRSSLGRGPHESLIVAGPDIVVAAAGLRRPRVVVSAGALLQLDDAELAAGVEHERGHIARRHRLIVLAGQLLLAVSRFLPGSIRALDSLQFHLERNADEYAVRRTGDPLALASAICKASIDRAGVAPDPALAGLSGGDAPERLRLLAEPPGRSPAASAAARLLAAGAAGLTLALALSAPALASSGVDHAGPGQPARVIDCD